MNMEIRTVNENKYKGIYTVESEVLYIVSYISAGDSIFQDLAIVSGLDTN